MISVLSPWPDTSDCLRPTTSTSRSRTRLTKTHVWATSGSDWSCRPDDQVLVAHEFPAAARARQRGLSDGLRSPPILRRQSPCQPGGRRVYDDAIGHRQDGNPRQHPHELRPPAIDDEHKCRHAEPGKDTVKSIIGLAIGFAIGGACRAVGVPLPAPPVLVGAFLVVAMTAGYSLTDRYLVKRDSTTRDLCGGPTGTTASGT